MNPIISVIIPVFNNQKYILECIDSVLLQTFQNFEVIIIDDHSTDNTKNLICEKYLTNKQIRLFENKGKGVSSARNYGLEISKGEYIMFLDSDDRLKKNCLEVSYKKLVEKDADIVKFNYYKIFEKQSIKNSVVFSKDKLIVNSDFERIIYPLFLNSYKLNNVWGQLISKRKIGNLLFDEDLLMGEDLKFNLNLYTSCERILFINEWLLEYRYNPNGTTNSYSINTVLKKINDVFSAYYEIYIVGKEKKYVSSEINEKIYKRILNEVLENYILLYKSNTINRKNSREVLEEILKNEKYCEIKKLTCKEVKLNSMVRKARLKCFNYNIKSKIKSILLNG